MKEDIAQEKLQELLRRKERLQKNPNSGRTLQQVKEHARSNRSMAKRAPLS